MTAEPTGRASDDPPADSERVEWLDYAKGLCIFFVVMLHASRYVQYAAGRESWMQAVVDFARPFRMPDFFLISGLFLSRVIDRDWRTYLDKKVVHFAYFYVLWLAIVCSTLVFSSSSSEHGGAGVVGTFLLNLIQPTTSLWFIHMLPIFFVITKLVRPAPRPLVLAVAASLQIAVVQTGVIVLDEGTERFVFFYAGYIFAPHVFALARSVMAHPRRGLLGLAAWGLLNGTMVSLGVASDAGVSLLLGGLGAMAIVSASALLYRVSAVSPLAYCGRNSLVIYLAYFLPMKVAKKAFFEAGAVHWMDLGTIVLLVTLTAVMAPLAFHRLVRDGPLRCLFARPAWAHLPAWAGSGSRALRSTSVQVPGSSAAKLVS